LIRPLEVLNTDQAFPSPATGLGERFTRHRACTVGYLVVTTAQASVLSAPRKLIGVRNCGLAAVNTLLKNAAGAGKSMGRTIWQK
jgi:hypothetical protein